MSAARSRRSLTTVAAFGVGLPLAGVILTLINVGALAGTPLHHYLSHAVEQVEIVMFCLALSGLLAKVWQNVGERRAFRAAVLPPWDGHPVPVAEAPKLLAGVGRLGGSVQKSWLVNRVAGVLDFLASRGSAADLDDHLRDLADGDANALENSYALIRFITWAIPILGFLGTVLGITGAINGVTPEKLENNISEVTDGLALAFNATALALALTMVTMFLSYLVDRLEQSVLGSVDEYTTRHLAHRFEREAAAGGDVAEVVLRTTDDLVKRQAEVWAKSLDEINRRHAEASAKAQERLTTALEAALEKTLKSHTERLAATEKVSGKLLEQVAALAAAVTQQHAALAKLQEGERQLVRLQETLARNLDSLAGAGSFEEAVHSLTAAVHLLTARASAAPPPPVKRPGVAA